MSEWQSLTIHFFFPHHSSSTSQRPLLRHFALTFWSLLSREHRAAGLIRLVKGIQAISLESEEAAEHQQSRRKRLSKSTRDSSSDRDIMLLRSLVPEANPALLELVLQLSLTTLVLARPQARLTQTQQRQRGIHQSEHSSPYIEVQAALVALIQAMKIAGAGLHGCGPNQTKRLAATVVRIASMSVAALQWQVDRCMTWRTGRGGPKSAGDQEAEEIEAAREGEAALEHLHSLVEVSSTCIQRDDIYRYGMGSEHTV